MSNNNICQILVIDPDSDWIDFAVQTLRGQGIGAQGVTDIDKIGQASKPVCGSQLVFMDLELVRRAPDQVRHFAEKENRYVVVLFSTGLTPHRMSRVFKLGAYDCVGKPYDSQSLIKLAKSLLREICLSTQDMTYSLTPNCIPVA
jgi:DNA-binding NtrC family response regulator